LPLSLSILSLWLTAVARAVARAVAQATCAKKAGIKTSHPGNGTVFILRQAKKVNNYRRIIV